VTKRHLPHGLDDRTRNALASTRPKVTDSSRAGARTSVGLIATSPTTYFGRAAPKTGRMEFADTGDAVVGLRAE
jgi:hypothetical protein